MIPKFGQGVIRQTRGSLKTLATASSQYVKKTSPLTPALAVRSFSIQFAKQSEVAINTSTPSAKPTDKQQQSLLDSLKEYENTGNLKSAIRMVQLASESGQATPAVYLQLVNLLKEAPFNIQECATVAHWFYSPDSNLPSEALSDITLWKEVLKLGFRFGNTYRSEDLRALVDRFTEIFDLTTLNDQTAWELLMRAYGILNRPNDISASLNKGKDNQDDEASFYSSALLAYAATDAHEDAEKILEKLKNNGGLSEHTLLKLIRSYGFKGDIARTSKYIDMHSSLFPETDSDNTMLLMAHKVALQQIFNKQVQIRGAHGLGLKPPHSSVLDQLHESWSELTKDMFKDDSKPVDITDCNIVLEYLTIANRIDPVRFPLEKAEEIFNSYMPGHYIQPNDASHRIMLVGYANTQQYNDPTRNVRLDKALELISKSQAEGIQILNHATFHALFRACIPHRGDDYRYDYFRLNSLLAIRPVDHNIFRLDPRVFEIEKIMLEAKLPHDRFTLTTLMTCLAAGGQFKALHKRWNSIKLHGLRRDVGMYRLMFALASLDPTASQRAIVVIKNELEREIPRKAMDWDTYTAMLDCCITAQSPLVAKEIMKKMRESAKMAYSMKNKTQYRAKYPFPDEPNYYLPLLRTSVAVPELNAKNIITEIQSKNVPYNQGIWEALLSKEALVEGNEQGIQQLFNKYTMARFEKEGKIPIPVREGSKPVVPFPSGPYNRLDMQFIDVYIGSLLDSQDISLVMDVLRTLADQTDKIGISQHCVQGILRLAKQEKSMDELAWFKQNILPKIH